MSEAKVFRGEAPMVLWINMGFGKNNTGVIIRENTEIVLLGQGDGAVITTTDLTMTEDFRLLKTEVIARITGLTTGDEDGLIFGLADAELSDIEVAEVIALDGPVDRNDNLANERAMRPVWILGTSTDLISSGRTQFRGHHGGPIMTAKPRWTFSSPEGWNWFVFNDRGAAITTGATLKVVATNYGVWVT